MTLLANLFFASLYAAQTAAMMAGIAAVCVGEWIGRDDRHS